MEVDKHVHTLTESFEPFAPKAHPGDQLLDRFADRLHFDERDPTQDRRPYLDELIAKVRADPLTVLAATDGSVPQSNHVTAPDAELNAITCAVHLAVKQADCQHIMVFTDSMGSAHRAVDPSVHSGQAFSLSACHALQAWFKADNLCRMTHYVSGRVTAPDAELNAILCAVRLAVKQANCQHIMVFTDSMGSAHRAVDPSSVSLQEWFKADDLRCITFVYVPSALRWDIHGEAHKYVTELKVRVGHCKMDNSIDVLRSKAVHSVLDSWSSTFQDPTYRGSEFLELQQPDGRLLQPSYLNGGPWLSTFGHSITEFARVCWCITGHTPIGVYYRHFKINEPHGCTCGAALQSCQHVLFHCHN
ncbi:unnamed protein product [Cyclocybe aegerita]|uniref:RNase H type-1 domain-containing protein n=1 Tax=Cyclocybe aegerita TaxID=1973307 RepID=A0A8S0XPX9_CYCAE|nr:unnamed protein product [Cyclocybe aegerita]